MTEELSVLSIKAERLGSVKEVKQLLTDFENVYNHLYTFEIIIDSLYNTQERQIQISENRIHRWRKMWKDYSNRKESPFDHFFFEMIYKDYFDRMQYIPKTNLIELQSKIDFDKIILPGDRLQLSRINIQSPGFWEFLGALNPLQQIREYLKDRHERKKDKAYRNRQEEEKGELEILTQRDGIINRRIGMLRELGYTETEIRQFVFLMVTQPLNILGRQQDNGFIEGPEQ